MDPKRVNEFGTSGEDHYNTDTSLATSNGPRAGSEVQGDTAPPSSSDETPPEKSSEEKKND